MKICHVVAIATMCYMSPANRIEAKRIKSVSSAPSGSSSRLLLTDLPSSSRQSKGYLTMGSMVSSSFDGFEDVAVIKSKSRILEFDSGSGAIDHQRQLSPSSDVVRMHLIATRLQFLPGGIKVALKKVGGDEELAKKYGEELAAPEVCTSLAEEIKRLQEDAPPGSKFIVCSALGTSAKENELARQGRPDFAHNRALNMKKHLQAAMEAVGAEGEMPDPIVKYRKHRVATLLMKSYTGTEPPCQEDDVKIPDIKRHSPSPPEVKNHSLPKVEQHVPQIEDVSDSESDNDSEQLDELEDADVSEETSAELKIQSLKTELEGLEKKDRRKRLRKLQLTFHPDKADPEHLDYSTAIFHFAQEWWEREFKHKK